MAVRFLSLVLLQANFLLCFFCSGIDTSAVAYFTNEACVTDGVQPSDPLSFSCEVYGVVLLRIVLPSGDMEIISLGDTAADVALPTGFTAVSLDITVIDESTRNFNLTLSIDSASHLEGGNITCDDTTPRNVAEAGCPIVTSAVAYFTNEACTNGGVKPSDPLLFTCKVYGVAILRVVLPTGDQEIISLGDTADDVALPVGFTAVSLDITEIDDSTRNLNLTLSIDSASRLEGGNITCDDTTPKNVAEARCPIITSAVAYFTNEACVTGGVRPSDPLLFTCKVYGIVILRVVLPTGDQEIISLGDAADDVALPTGFTAVSLDITEIDDSTRDFNLTLSIESASRLEGGNITCDDTTPKKVATAKCPTAPLSLSFVNDTPLVVEYYMTAHFIANREGVQMKCNIPRLGNEKTDCSSGNFSHTFTSDQMFGHKAKPYILHIEANDPNTNDNVTLIGKYRVFGHQENYFCSLNMINTGTSPILQGGSLEFISVGKATKFECKIDKSTVIDPCGDRIRNIMERKDVYSLNISNLSSGEHTLVVYPTEGCSIRFCFKRMKYVFNVTV